MPVERDREQSCRESEYIEGVLADFHEPDEEARARAGRKGMWRGEFTPPWDWPRAAPPARKGEEN